MKKIVLLILSIGLAVPAIAGDETAQQAPKRKKEPKICKTVEATHSRMGNRVCKTAAQWAASQGQSADTLQDLERSGKTN